MRPLRLEMEGFSTFRQHTVLDFGDLDLVALTGSTGAGKSTVIDAMTFALYGSVARYGNTGVVEPVIHQLSTEAKVRFDFEVGGQRYIATRVTRRQQRSGSDGRSRRATTKEARLERVLRADLPDQTEVMAGTVKELDAAVVALLGLTFNQFTRTVVLPQGEFANFLRDEPTKRQELLKRLLDLEVYSRMGTEARKRAEAADQQTKTLEQELARLQVPDEAHMTALAGRLEALGELRLHAETSTARLTELDAVLEPLRGRVAEMQSDIDALGAISVPVDLVDRVPDVKAAQAAMDKATSELDTARQSLDQARMAATKIGDRGELVELRQRRLQADAASERLDALTERQRELSIAVDEATDARTAAEQHRTEAHDKLVMVRQSADAVPLVESLVAGEACPVCQQTVHTVPEHGGHEGGSKLPTAEKAAAEASKGVEKATAAQAGAEAELKALEAQRVEWSAVVKTASDLPTLEEVEQKLARLKQAEVEQEDLVNAASSAEQALVTARRMLDEIRASESSQRQQFGRQRDLVGHLQPPEAGFESLHADWTTLAQWAENRSAEITAERTRLVEEGKRQRAERDTVVESLLSASSELGVRVDGSAVARAVELVLVAEADTRAERERAVERRDHADRLSVDIAERSTSRELNRELGRHLSAKGFEAWLLTEAFDDITERATVRLLELSAGRYSLAALDRDIAIVDHHNADEQRTARTLSGGETFLASLALALALADSIAALAPVDAPRLESMFLDEGFGTLDPDTLDVVASAIEELAATGRMIGIVTHVRDLAERMPARFEIKKLPDGSSAELVTL